MKPHAKALDELVQYLRSTLGQSVSLRVARKGEDRLAIHVGSEDDAVIGVEVSDPERPSFRISYPERKAKRNSRHHMVITTMDAALRSGVAWVALQLAEHGAVTPEFKD